MKKRTFKFNGSDGAAEALITVLKHYVDIAYPRSGSDCAATARQALRDIIDKISNDQICEISRRQRPMLKAAVKWFYTESEYANADDEIFHKLLSQFQRSK